jgi:hypothetical protein
MGGMPGEFDCRKLAKTLQFMINAPKRAKPNETVMWYFEVCV